MLKVKKSLLKKAVNALEKFDNRTGFFPDESFFRLSVRDDKFLLHKSDFMNDLVIRLKADLPGKADGWREGVCVRPNVFETVIRSLSEKPDFPVELSLEDFFLRIAERHYLPGTSGAEYPDAPAERIETWSSISRNLVNDLAFVAPAMFDHEEPNLLNGVSIGEDVTATDGRGIHCLRGHGFSETNIIIPGDYVNLLLKLDPAGGMIGVGESGRIYAQKGLWLLIGTPLNIKDSTYPDYHQLLDNEYAYVFEINRSDFLSALEEASVYVSEYEPHSTTLRMSFEPEKNRLKLKLTNDATGRFSHKLPVKTLQATEDSLLIGINVNYLRDAVSGFQDPSLFLHLNDNKQHVQVTGRNPDKVAIIMPVRLEEEA
ncbi:MAG: DNA polymerase III subunit beta [PVC group bacterium]